MCSHLTSLELYHRKLLSHSGLASVIVAAARGRSRPLIENHVQPRPARDQNVPGSPPPYTRIEIIAQGGEPGYEARHAPHVHGKIQNTEL